MSLGIYVAGLTLLAAITAAIALSRVQVAPDLKRRVLLFFVIVGCLAPLINSFLPILIVATISLWLLLPAERGMTTPFCLAALLVVPSFYSYNIPFPGINFLISYELALGVAWLAFLPLVFRFRLRLNAADLCMIAYVFWMVVLDFRGVSATQGLRHSVVHVSGLLLPYFAVSRSLRTSEEQDRMVEAIFVIAVILCCATIYTERVGWHYLNFTQGAAAFVTFEQRFGLFRTGATLASGLFGLICTFALLIVVIRREIVRGTLARIVAVLLFFFGLLASGARGAMVAGVIVGAVWIVSPRLNLRMFQMAAIALVVATPALIASVTNADLSVLGDQGTVSYRQQLLVASMQQFYDAPILGDKYFLSSPHLAGMVQGQGIIDIVNSYLQIVLAYGIVGLCLFGLTGYFVMSGLVRHISLRRAGGLQSPLLGLLLAFLAGYLFLIATTSQTSYVALFGVVLFGLGRAAGMPQVASRTVGGVVAKW